MRVGIVLGVLDSRAAFPLTYFLVLLLLGVYVTCILFFVLFAIFFFFFTVHLIFFVVCLLLRVHLYQEQKFEARLQLQVIRECLKL